MTLLKNFQFLPAALLVATLYFTTGCGEDSVEVNDGERNDPSENPASGVSGYPIVDTDQSSFYNNENEISEPTAGDPFYGQDAQYQGNQPAYVDNGDGTISDEVTGLMWSKSIDFNEDGAINVDDKLTYEGAMSAAEELELGGYTDWRLPTIKELYSLILFSGQDVSGYDGSDTDNLIPFIDTDYFEFGYGDTQAGERIIDAQYASSTKYVHYTMDRDETLFGVNFADGRIKGYGLTDPGSGEAKAFYVAFVRGSETYGVNSFLDNGNGTITDQATGLMWMQNDSGEGMLWEEALLYAESYEYAGYSDWRLPNVKEIQSLVDYTRSPETSGSAAIDDLFSATSFANEAGETDYGYYWSGTTHENRVNSSYAAYVCFGRALGYMNDWTDVHGAGAQRSDPKVGDPNDYPTGHGPQGDAIRIYNYVRLVRDYD